MLRMLQLLSIVIAIPAAACADLVVPHASNDAHASAASAVRSIDSAQWEPTGGSLGGVGYPAGPGILQPVRFAPESQTRIVEVIPPAPDSASLVLWALGSAAVWQLGRSTHKFGLHVAPDWYHTGGPTQVGHATPLDLDFGDMPLAVFARPACRLRFSSISCRNRERWLPPQRWHVPTRDPRGPPVFRLMQRVFWKTIWLNSI